MLARDGVFVTVWKGTAEKSEDDLVFLGELVAAGELKPAIDQRYELPETAEAPRYVESGRKTGNVVIIVAARGLQTERKARWGVS